MYKISFSSSAGVGRTGTFITIDTVLEQVKKYGVVNVAGVINKLRHQRMKMVQNLVRTYARMYGSMKTLECVYALCL